MQIIYYMNALAQSPLNFLHLQLLAMWLADKFISQQNGCEIKKPIKTRF